MEVIIISITFEIQIKEFKQWLRDETANILQPLNEQAKKLVDKIKERLDNARKACEKLTEEGTREMERGKAARKARVTEKLSRYFQKQIDKIAFPDKVAFSELHKLHKDLEKMFSYVARERNAWFPRISPLFIITRKKVDFAFTRLVGSISELGNFLSTEYSKAEAIEKLFLEADEMMRLLDESSKYEGHRASIEEKMQFLQQKMEESEKNIESIKSSAELSDLAEMNRKIQQLRKQVKYDLRHLQKPFMKFANLKRGPGYTLSAEEIEKLSQYLEDSFIAFATEKPSYPTLKSILRKIERAMDGGKLKLKSSRLRKSIEEINAILNKNKLDSLHQDCTHAFSLNQQLIYSKETQVAQRKAKQLQGRFEELRKRKDAAGARLDTLVKEQKQLLKKVNEQKKMLEKLVHKILERHINLKLG